MATFLRMHSFTLRRSRRSSSLGYWLFMLFLVVSAGACKKDAVGADPEPDPTSSIVPYYKLQRVENMNAQTDDDNPTVTKLEILFSLKFKKEQPLSFAKTNRWDISFSGLYNSFLGANNKNDPTNSGYNGPGVGGVLIVARAFDNVVDIPADSEFKTGTKIIGTDDAGAFGEGIGWYLYDYGGTLVSDGRDDKMHVAYALGNPLGLQDGTVIPARTIIIRTAAGDYAKLKMISCYKDAYTADTWFRDTPHMFFTFEYVIVPKGSTKFEIK